ncbi:type 4 pilus biogenesis operon protein [Myxococcus fulvus 124B02]|nr:type 4 pilus biogenesis operon protein [Myxococcus fulvus 124B02]
MMRTRGMTLLELMIAIAIVGMMVSLAVVGISKPLDGQREATATRELWSSALRARQRAIATNQPVRIVVESNVLMPDGTRKRVARWERLTCDNDFDNNTCPRDACTDTTCRASPECCSETGPDIVIPDSMTATPVHGLCFLPGSARAVKSLDCMRGQLDNVAALTAAAPGNIQLNFTAKSGRPRSLLMVEPLTGLASLLDCDSVRATQAPVAECTAAPTPP